MELVGVERFTHQLVIIQMFCFSGDIKNSKQTRLIIHNSHKPCVSV